MCSQSILAEGAPNTALRLMRCKDIIVESFDFSYTQIDIRLFEYVNLCR